MDFKNDMKKYILTTTFAIFSFLSIFAIPNGCYSGESRHNRDRCAIQISDNTFHVTNKEGEVIARWTIVSDENGKLTLKSVYGATVSATWWREDGKTYLKFNYELFTRMD